MTKVEINMFDKLQALALAAFVGAGAFVSMPASSGNAMALPMAGSNEASAKTAAGDLYQEAARRDQRRRQWYYDRRYHGQRYRYRYGGYNYYYGGYYYQRPYWNLTIPFVFEAPVAPYYYQPRYYPRYYGGLNQRHINWCFAQYRSYNVRSNTWVSYSGQLRQCISPFGP